MNDPTTRLAAFREDAPTAFNPPPFDEFQAAGRQRRVRTTLTTVAAAVVVLAIVVAIGVGGGLRHHPEVATTPTPSPSPSADLSRGIDLRGRLTIDLPEWEYAPDSPKHRSDCVGHGKTRFPSGNNSVYALVALSSDPPKIAGELRGLTGAAQLVVVHCVGELGNASDSGEFAVLLATPTGPGTLRGLDYLVSWGPNRVLGGLGFTDGGDTYVDISDGQVVQRRVYRWTGTQAAQVDGGTAFASPTKVKTIDPASFWYDPPFSPPAGGLCGWGELSGRGGVALVDGAGATLVRREDGCLRMTARLAYATRATIPGAGDVVLVSVTYDLAGQQQAIAYALFDWNGTLQVKQLRFDPAVVAVDGQRITGNRLEVTARTATGATTYRWRFQVVNANGFAEAWFVPVR